MVAGKGERDLAAADSFHQVGFSAFSGVEREDEVYSARQLAARDTDEKKKPVKPKEEPAVSGNLVVEPPLQTTAKLRIRVQLNNNNNNNNNNSNKLVDDKQRFSVQTPEPPTTVPTSVVADRAKPLTVTSSTFRAADNKPRKEPVQPQDGSRKDNTFPRPVQPTEKSFAGVQALKESLEESLKENDEPKRNQQCRQQSAASRAPFVFQVRDNTTHIVGKGVGIFLQQAAPPPREKRGCRLIEKIVLTFLFFCFFCFFFLVVFKRGVVNSIRCAVWYNSSF